MDEQYKRVIPRDLFNEAKLLKCMGRLILLIHDEKTPAPMEFIYNGTPFRTAQMNDGDITIVNVKVYIKETHFIFKTGMNSKDNWPLLIQIEDDRGGGDFYELPVFNSEGEFTKEFIQHCKSL